MSVYQPDFGHLIWLNFTPHAGTEQGGRRPALVLSPKRYNIATGLCFACPITSKAKGSPFEVPLPRGARLEGVVLANQLRSLDWLARDAEYHADASDDVVAEVQAIIESILYANR